MHESHFTIHTFVIPFYPTFTQNISFHKLTRTYFSPSTARAVCCCQLSSKSSKRRLQFRFIFTFFQASSVILRDRILPKVRTGFLYFIFVFQAYTLSTPRRVSWFYIVTELMLKTRVFFIRRDSLHLKKSKCL